MKVSSDESMLLQCRLIDLTSDEIDEEEKKSI
jgi:hypothetical protein